MVACADAYSSAPKRQAGDNWLQDDCKLIAEKYCSCVKSKIRAPTSSASALSFIIAWSSHCSWMSKQLFECTQLCCSRHSFWHCFRHCFKLFLTLHFRKCVQHCIIADTLYHSFPSQWSCSRHYFWQCSRHFVQHCIAEFFPTVSKTTLLPTQFPTLLHVFLLPPHSPASQLIKSSSYIFDGQWWVCCCSCHSWHNFTVTSTITAASSVNLSSYKCTCGC